MGVGSDGSIVAGDSISDETADDEGKGSEVRTSATRAGGVPSTLAEAALAVRDSADALAPRLGDLGGLDLGLATPRPGVSDDAFTDSWRISIAAAASFAASASSSATRSRSAASAATAVSSAANSGASAGAAARAPPRASPRGSPAGQPPRA